MSIVTIPNQLVAFNFPLSDCDSCHDEEYCSPIPDGQTVDFQFKQTPCGINLNCDPAFNKISENLTTDSDFLGGLGAWVASNAQWTYTANHVHFDYGAGPSGGTLSQTIATALKNNKWYILKCDITNVTGTLAIDPSLGGITSPVVIGIGGIGVTILLHCGPGTDLSLSQNLAGCTFDIDNIELYELAPCWLGAAGWIFGEDGAVTHDAGTASQLTMGSSGVVPGNYYQAVVTIYNYVSGTVKVVCGSTQSSAISGEGSTIVYITANGTGLGLLPSNDFIGTISYFTIKKLKNDYTVGILDLADATEYTTGSIATYFEDYVTVKLNPLLYVPDIDCFKIVLHDSCTEVFDDIVRDGSFKTSFSSGSPWQIHNNISNGFHDAVSTPTVINATLIQPAKPDTAFRTYAYLPGITTFYYQIKLRGQLSATAYSQLAIGGHFLSPLPSTTGWTAPGDYEGFINTGQSLDNKITYFQKGDVSASATDRVRVTDIVIYPVQYINRDFISQCFQIIADSTCIREVNGYCDKKAFGFAFEIPTASNPSEAFKLRSWIRFELFDPIFPEEETAYTYSDGTRKISNATSDELIELRTDFVPEWVHRTLRIMKICDHFFVNSIEYVAKAGDYVPEYLEGENLRLTSVLFQIRPKTILLQNNNCQ
jgi:hypothetical protein